MKLTIWIVLVIVYRTEAKVTLPKIFSDNMVVQRDKALRIWGWAAKDEAVTVTFNGQTVLTSADKMGSWKVVLKPMSFGGPFKMAVVGKSNTVTFKNILIGDVWICSGQSNMEWLVENSTNSEDAIPRAIMYPNIRFFTVDKNMSYHPQQDVVGGQWVVCSPSTVAEFSAVAYFFGRTINQDTNIPIGLINTSWGGTNIQTWTSWDVMSHEEPYQKITREELDKFSAGQALYTKYREALKHDQGLEEKWYEPSYSTKSWNHVTLPARWEDSAIGNTDGIIWFSKEFQVSAASLSRDVKLHLGMIDDEDITYINGRVVGEEDEWNKERHYAIPKGLLVEGINTVTIRMKDNQGPGGLFSNSEQIYVDFGDSRISLAGDWRYKASATTTNLGMPHSGPNEFPSQLFNAMVAPLTSFAIKGAIWYQGEANTDEADRYHYLFKNLINDWRNQWNEEFPFYWVQLPNFMAPTPVPSESKWAELREAQSRTLELPNTGQAVTIDIGEANDIHPRNKQLVGYRLALVALKNTYGKNVVCSAPRYQSMKVEQGKVILIFSQADGGFKVNDRYGYVKGFAIAGIDGKFVWAKGYVDGNQVVVYSDEIKNPIEVRYAWADNPEDANLFSNHDLPVAPFRTISIN